MSKNRRSLKNFFRKETSIVSEQDQSKARVAVGITADNPIRKPEDDVLGRSNVAASFAEQIFSIDAIEGFVVGVLGPWGSGKTSFINLTRHHLEDRGAVILDFNPWMFSGTEQLIELFFFEISTQLKLRQGFAEVSKKLEEYGEAFAGWGWLPVIGTWIERVRGGLKFWKKIREIRGKGISGARDKVKEALADIGTPLVIVLDDVDRLTPEEIGHIFKLVRLTANFPNIIYILAFDRLRTEESLTRLGLPGRDYLEKILQVVIDLPEVPPHLLQRQILTEIDTALSGIEQSGPFDEDVWQDVFFEIIRPLMRNMRDVRRYAIAVSGTVRALKGQVALADVLGLEAIRIFLPDVFCQIHKSVEALTTTRDSLSDEGNDPQEQKEQIDRLIKAADDRAEVVNALIKRIFPAGKYHIGGEIFTSAFKKQWLNERRVAHEYVLRLYLERVVGEGLQVVLAAQEAWAHMADLNDFNRCLRSIKEIFIQDVIALLEEYKDKYTRQHVESGTVVLLNLLPDLPERPTGMLGLDNSRIIGRVVNRLLRSLNGEDEVAEVVRDSLPQITSLSSKLKLVNMVGLQEGSGPKLVSEQAANEFQTYLLNEIRRTTADDLAMEKELLRILLFAKRNVNPESSINEVPDLPEVTTSLLRSAQYEVRSQSEGSRYVKRSNRLDWDALVELFDDEAILHQRIKELKASKPEGIDDLLKLVDEYLAGQHPNDTDEE